MVRCVKGNAEDSTYLYTRYEAVLRARRSAPSDRLAFFVTSLFPDRNKRGLAECGQIVASLLHSIKTRLSALAQRSHDRSMPRKTLITAAPDSIGKATCPSALVAGTHVFNLTAPPTPAPAIL